MRPKVEVLTEEQAACALWPVTEALRALALSQAPGSSSLVRSWRVRAGCRGGPRLSPALP